MIKELTNGGFEVKKKKGAASFKEPEYKEPNFDNLPKVGAAPEDEDEDDLSTEETALEVQDVSSIEYSGDDKIERRTVMFGQDPYTLLVFPKELLQAKFMDRAGNTSLPMALKSEWFKNVLKHNGFTSDWRFRKDDSGRFLLPIPDEDAYGIWQRL